MGNKITSCDGTVKFSLPYTVRGSVGTNGPWDGGSYTPRVLSLIQ